MIDVQRCVTLSLQNMRLTIIPCSHKPLVCFATHRICMSQYCTRSVHRDNANSLTARSVSLKCWLISDPASSSNAIRCLQVVFPAAISYFLSTYCLTTSPFAYRQQPQRYQTYPRPKYQDADLSARRCHGLRGPHLQCRCGAIGRSLNSTKL